MRFDILTLFPEMFNGPFSDSMIKKARENGIIDINLIDIRDYTTDKHNTADDYPYGGGAGMVLKVEPIYYALADITEDFSQSTTNILLTPRGQKLDQSMVKDLSGKDRLVLICGHYEGIDERIRNNFVDQEVSIGDYVLTGGEIPAMVLVDAVARLLPGVLGHDESKKNDSFYNGILDYPHYTRPQEFKGMEVPEILLSGNHQLVDRWRKKEALKRTYLMRPDLIENTELTQDQQELLREIKQDIEGDSNNE
ncbi:MAG TPA: tRNA (guanosine(37)-N1)-methyltransferase TrmD [Halanaerobiales bacterium]|nr:tRNA (guanosine(37)-N1)-methyltransferase TrmD [Halanaerobiales bacterium]